MKRILVFSLVFASAILIAADLTTKSGTVYANYRIVGVTDDGVSVSFRGGIVKVPIDDLPDDLRKKYYPGEGREQEVRNQLEKAKSTEKTITFSGKDGKRYENCRIQRIGASGLTLKINGTSVYIPFRWIKNLTNGVLAAPSFAVNLPRTSYARETSPVSEPSGVSEGTDTSHSLRNTTVNTTYTGPRGGTYYYNSKGRKTYVRKR